MPVVRGSPDLFPAALCVVYICRCGAAETAFGAASDRLPAGWTESGPPSEDEPSVICPRCSRTLDTQRPAADA